MPEQSRTGQEETLEHMGRSPEPKKSLTKKVGDALRDRDKPPPDLARIAAALERIATAQEQLAATMGSAAPTVIFSQPPPVAPESSYGEIVPEDTPPQQQPIVSRSKGIKPVDPGAGSQGNNPSQPPR